MKKILLLLLVISAISSSYLSAQPVITYQTTDQIVAVSNNAVFNVTVTGNGPFTYQWQFNGTNLPNDIITTVAGNGSGSPNNGTFSGDGGPATNAGLYFPQGIAFDTAGNLYIADNNNDRVRRVDTNGIITTVVGNGNGAPNGGSYSGDGGAGTNAALYRPNNITFDTAGNMFIADIFNHRVRKVDTNSVISSVPTNSPFNLPASVALDSANNLYVADVSSANIFKVDTNNIVTMATTNAGLLQPQCATLDSNGNLYIADTEHGLIRKMDTNGIITTVAGRRGNSFGGDGGAATNAFLNYPWFITFDQSGDYYIADSNNERIRKVDTNGIITTVAGNGDPAYAGDGGAATNASLYQPACVALDNVGNLYIADWYNDRIREVHFAGFPTLTLPHASTNNDGDYTVVITGAGGSVTSSVIALNVVIPPDIVGFSNSNDIYNFTWNSQSNFIYQLQYTTNLVAPVWQNVGNPVTATNNTLSTSDIPGTDIQRFYRVQMTQ